MQVKCSPMAFFFPSHFLHRVFNLSRQDDDSHLRHGHFIHYATYYTRIMKLSISRYPTHKPLFPLQNTEDSNIHTSEGEKYSV